MIGLRDEQRACWEANRYAHLPGALDAEEHVQLLSWVEELAAWPETPGRWMKYFEGEHRQLCRVEDFLPYHDALRALLERDDLLGVLAELLGEPVRLFKEKINFKLPGGQGFAAHQDAPAFSSFGQTRHVTVMLSVDATTPGNGCLEVVDGHGGGAPLRLAEDGTLHPDVIAVLDWHPLPTKPGDVVLLDSWVPHRSGPNRSRTPRRALYATYNGVSQGDHRADYFARKRRAFPPECERVPGAALPPEAAVFNLGNPIR